MPDLIRPEARAALWQWRETLAGLSTVALGVTGTQSYGLWVWLGWGGIALGAALALTGIQRARFRVRGASPGVVEIDELQLRYMGPFSGGEMALDMVMVIALGGSASPPHWVLTNAYGEQLTVPSGATGAETLFDAFTTLPGFRMERALSAMAAPQPTLTPIWRRPKAAVDTARISPHG